MIQHLLKYLFIFWFTNLCFSQNYADKNHYLVDSLDLSLIQESELKHLDSCLSLFHASKNDLTKIEIINSLVKNSYNNHVWPKYNQWIYHRTKTTQNFNKQLYQKLNASSISNFGYFEQILGNNTKALTHYNKSLTIYKQIKDSAGIANSLNNLGSLHYEDGAILKSLEHYHKSLNTRILIKDTFGIANSYNNIGNIYREQKNTPEALEYFFKSLQLREELNTNLISSLYQNIGLCYIDLKKYTKANNYLKKALKQDSINNDHYGLGTSYSSIGISHENQNNYLKALDYHERSLHHFKIANYKKFIAKSLINIANCKIQLDFPFTEILKHFHDAFDIFKTIDNLEGMCYSHMGIAKLHLKHNNYKKAEKHTNLFLEIGKSKNHIKKEAYLLLSKTYQQQDNHKKALEYHALSSEINNQLSQEVINKISDIKLIKNQSEQDLLLKQKELQHQLNLSQTRNESQKKVITIGIIAIVIISLLALVLLNKFQSSKKQKNKIADMYQIVQISLDEKSILLKEIHHRVKNNLQVISSLLRLQERNSNQLETIEILKESRTRVNSMALVHEMLYQVDNLSLINYNDYIEKLVKKLIVIYKKNTIDIDFKFKSPQLQISIEKAIPLGLLLNEIISNAIKHAFNEQEKGTIYLTIVTIKDHEYQITIGDDGSGFQHSLDNPKTDSLGLKLIQKMAKQLNSNVIKTNSKKGTKYTFVFKSLNN